MVADEYARAGFTVVVQDVILGDDLRRYLELLTTRPRYLVVLTPRPEVVEAREQARHKVGYGAWTLADLHRSLWRETPRLGRWLDNSDQAPDETVEAILSDLPAALV